MGKLGDMARITATVGRSKSPDPAAAGDYASDAWLVWAYIREQIESNPDACPPAMADGVPGHLWTGVLNDVKIALFRHSRYDAGPAASADEKDAAAQEWRRVHSHLTRETGNLYRRVNRGRFEPGTWWVRDEWNGTPITPAQWDRIRAAKNGTPGGRRVKVEPYTTPAIPAPATEPATTPATPAQPDIPTGYLCRFTEATGCTTRVNTLSGITWHEDHSHPAGIGLYECPLCDQYPRTGTQVSRSGRGQHLSQIHGITANSPERRALDIRQTTTQYRVWLAREQAAQARRKPQAETTAPEPVPDAVPVVVPEPAPAPAPEEHSVTAPATTPVHPAVTAVQDLVTEVTDLRRKIADLESQSKAADMLRAISETLRKFSQDGE